MISKEKIEGDGENIQPWTLALFFAEKFYIPQ